jgi:N6-L-threonylcarbamoyladenine synthase
VLLALETSCDETAVAICDATGRVLASEISSQVELHRPYGGVVPEIASRNHLLWVRPLVEKALATAGVSLRQIQAFAATAGPGLSSSLLIGNTVAKAFATALQKPFLAINHLEGHLLSPFIGLAGGVVPSVALIVSGGHTQLLHLAAVGQYRLLGTTRDDAAGEAFDKGAKMLGLPYPGGPEIDKLARSGDPTAIEFPRSMLDSGDGQFSFSGLKTSLRSVLPKLGAKPGEPLPSEVLADLCASYQEAIVDVLVQKTLWAAKSQKSSHVSISGGVSCNGRLRQKLADACARAAITLHLAQPQHTTDNAAMIAYAAVQHWKAGRRSSLEQDVNPNLQLSAQ